MTPGAGGFTGVQNRRGNRSRWVGWGSNLGVAGPLAVAEASLADGSAEASIVLAVKNHRAWIDTVHWQDGQWTASGSARDVELEPSSLNTNRPGLWRMHLLKNFQVVRNHSAADQRFRALLSGGKDLHEPLWKSFDPSIPEFQKQSASGKNDARARNQQSLPHEERICGSEKSVSPSSLRSPPSTIPKQTATLAR